MKMGDRLVKDAHVLLHPIRFRIVEQLAEKPVRINGMSKAMGEECGFVNSKYEISEQLNSNGKRSPLKDLYVESIYSMRGGA